MIGYRDITTPETEPITLQQAKDHLRIDYSEDDTYITGLISAARSYVEAHTNRAIYARSVRLTLDWFPLPSFDGTVGAERGYLERYYRQLEIRLPKPSAMSVESLSYVDDAGETHTLDESSYIVDLNSDPARIAPAPGYTWPSQNNYRPGAVTVMYTAGTYTDETLPWTVRAAMLLVIGHLFKNREASTGEALKTLPLGVAELLRSEVYEQVC